MAVRIGCGTRAAIHRVTGDSVLLTTSRRNDLLIMAALASDPEAQQWLGWRSKEVLTPKRISAARKAIPGGEYLSWTKPPFRFTVEVEPGTVAGQVVLQSQYGFWHLGISLAPELRGQGHGRRALRAATAFLHRHLGLPQVRAGTHPDNLATRRALTAAGFEPTDGPSEHPLPCGRVSPTLWYAHSETPTAKCRWLTLSQTPTP